MTQTAAFKLMNAQAVTGDGPVFNLEFPQLVAEVQMEIFGSPARASVSILGLLDGGTWGTICTLDTAQGYLSGELVPLQLPILVRQIKATVNTLTAGTTNQNPSVSVYFASRG